MITIWVHRDWLDKFVKLLSNELEEETIIPFATFRPTNRLDEQNHIQLLITYDEFIRLKNNV